MLNVSTETFDSVLFFPTDPIKELSVADLLETGRKVIEEEELDICPLCEQEIDRKRLLGKII